MQLLSVFCLSCSLIVTQEAPVAVDPELAAQPPPVPEPPATTLGVFSLAITGLDPGLEATAIDAVAQAIGGVAGFLAISRTELNAMLGAERINDVLGCTDVTCMAEIGAAAGVEKLVSGSLTQIDGGVIVSLQLVNTRYGSVENRSTLEWKGPLADLAALVGAAVETLIVPLAQRAPGALRVDGIAADAVVLVDGEPRGLGPLVVAPLPVGVHTLRIEAPGHLPHQAMFVTRQGVQTAIDVLLQPLPFYRRWWFWTAAGVAVAGAVAGGVVAAINRDSVIGSDGKSKVQFFVPGELPQGIGGGR